MSPRARVAAAAAGAALAAAAVAAGVAYVSRDDGGGATRAEPPPLALEFASGGDREQRLLARAVALYREGDLAEAQRMFDQGSSVDARVGSAMASWPNGTVAALERLATEEPRRAVVRVNLGLALLWSGRREAAAAAWRAALAAEPDSPSAIRADDLLHPRTPGGIPTFVPSFPPPRRIANLPPARQLSALRAAARTSVRGRLLLGIAYQRLGRPRSAERVFAEAAARAPDDVEAQVAAAVGRFSKSRPARAFSRLGPLTRRFPRAPTVRFHLGLLLLWMGDVRAGERQLERARALGPRSPLGREAARLLREIRRARSSGG